MRTIFTCCFLFILINASAQLPPSPDSMHLLLLNRRIDDLVVQQQVVSLDSLYANDFVFSHGSGRVEGKADWLKSVARNRYPIRRHDSVMVQQHGAIAVLKGKMYIERVDKDKIAKYIRATYVYIQCVAAGGNYYHIQRLKKHTFNT